MLGIIGAVDEEAKAIISEMTNVSKEEIGGLVFYKGIFSSENIIFVQSGIGKVNAAMTATLLLERYNVEKVIFSGVAGALDKKLKIGDIVIGTDIVQYDMDVSAFGYKKGQVPQMSVWSFYTDKSLIEKIKSLVIPNINIYYGRIITGDKFISKGEQKIQLGTEFSALCCDMESAAVAQVCYRLNKKFLIVRSISDSITDESDMEYNEFVKLAAENSKKVIKYLLI